MPETQTIGVLLKWAQAQFSDSDSAGLDARLLLCHCLDCTPTYLYTWPEREVEESQLQGFCALVEKRQSGHPVAHLIGYREFWDLKLRVSPYTLIPRPETELLVETALRLPLTDEARVLDLGTGTGAIALALGNERPHWKITAVDAVAEAVQLAEANRAAHALNNVTVLQSDWFTALENEQFDLIVSNPPYVETDSRYLHQGDVRFEPASALTSGADGLDDIRHIINHAPAFQRPGGWLAFEHGHEQGEAVQALQGEGGYREVCTVDDLNGLARVTYGRLTTR